MVKVDKDVVADTSNFTTFQNNPLVEDNIEELGSHEERAQNSQINSLTIPDEAAASHFNEVGTRPKQSHQPTDIYNNESVANLQNLDAISEIDKSDDFEIKLTSNKQQTYQKSKFSNYYKEQSKKESERKSQDNGGRTHNQQPMLVCGSYKGFSKQTPMDS